MQAGVSLAFALVRVPRGEPRPSEERFLDALQQDREQLRLPSTNGRPDLEIAGPYAITVDGKDFDEYVVWER